MRRHRGERGTVTMMEMLAVTMLTGLIVLTLAPLDRQLLRAGADAQDRIVSAFDLARAARALARDARGAAAVRTGDQRIEMSMPGGRRIVWRAGASGLTRSWDDGAGARARRVHYAGVVSLAAETAGPSLVRARLTSARAERREIAVFLRNAGGPS